ncbi:hypothetical protein MTO96_013577 [Rhipicephalus appendiculatus]
MRRVVHRKMLHPPPKLINAGGVGLAVSSGVQCGAPRESSPVTDDEQLLRSRRLSSLRQRARKRVPRENSSRAASCSGLDCETRSIIARDIGTRRVDRTHARAPLHVDAQFERWRCAR